LVRRGGKPVAGIRWLSLGRMRRLSVSRSGTVAVAQFRVFLSAVSSAYTPARDALADDLQAHDVIVRIQRSFRDNPAAPTLLHALHDYIAQCDVIICLIGSRSGGGFPVPSAAASFPGILPPGVAEASYTQWEFHLARHLKRRCIVYFAADPFDPPPAPASVEDRPDLQAAFISHVKSFGKRAITVGSTNEFCRMALKDLLQAPIPPALSSGLTETLARRDKHIALPYPSLGPLFKGRDDFLARLHARLHRSDGGAAAITSNTIHGIGGIGKTRAAVEYAWVNQQDYRRCCLSGPTPQRTWTPTSPGSPPRCNCHRPPRRTRTSDAMPSWPGCATIPAGC
jgi:hypothetical protein